MRIKLSLANNKILCGEFHKEGEGRIELHNAFFTECPSFIFNISIRLEDILLYVEEKEEPCTRTNTAPFLTDDQYTKYTCHEKTNEHYEPCDIEKDGKIVVNDSDLGRIEDIKIEQQNTKCYNGHTPLYDQIKENERRFGTKFEFDESLYTSELDKKSDFYKSNVERAKKIEQKILKNKKRDEFENEERYSAVKVKDTGLKRGLQNTKSTSKDEDCKKNMKHIKQIEDKFQNKEPNKGSDAITIRKNGDSIKMNYDDNKTKINERGWKKERQRKNSTKNGEKENEKLNNNSSEAALSVSQINLGSKTNKGKTPAEIWSTFETKTIPSSVEVKHTQKESGKQTTKTISFGKPTDSKYKTFNDLYNTIVGNFKGNKETKKWGFVDDYKTFKGYSNEYYTYKYSK